MDLHRTASSTSSHAPVRDAERLSGGASEPLPGSDAWLSERKREEAELETLGAQITELWGHINAATAQFLILLAEFDRREARSRQTFPRKRPGRTPCSREARRPRTFPRKRLR